MKWNWKKTNTVEFDSTPKDRRIIPVSACGKIHLFLEYCVYPMSDSTRQGVLTNYVSISPVCYFSPEGIQESEGEDEAT